MRRLLAITAILVAGAAIYLIARGGGSADGGSERAVAAADRGHRDGHGSRSRGGDSQQGGGSSTPTEGAKPRRAGPKAPSGHAPRRDAPAAEKPLTRKQFIRQADVICGDAHEQVGRIGRRLLKIGLAAAKGKVPSDAYYRRSAALTVQSQRVAERAIQDLEALPGPSDHRVDRYLEISGTEAQLLGYQAEALRQHDPSTVQKLNLRLVKLSRGSRKLAESYGFHVCGGTGA